jgi:hypothetical protein
VDGGRRSPASEEIKASSRRGPGEMVPRRSTALVLTAVGLLVLTYGLGWALAPDIGTAAAADRSTRTLVGSQGGGAGLHDYGSVYLYENNTTAWREESADSYFDVTRLENGSVMAGFMHGGYEDCGPYEAPCTHTGFRIIDPTAASGPRVVYEYSFPVRTRANSEVHDVERLPSGEFLLTDMEHERIMTVRSGEVTWQWNASALYEPPADPTRTDWLHINDVDRIGDGRYLVSVRNANQLVVVQRGEGAVEVVNRDPTPDEAPRRGDESVLKRQHNPQWLSEDAVLVADSENNRIVELHRSDDGDWEVAWRLTSAEGVRFSWPRDADRLPNGNTLITDSANQRLVEVNETGAVVWSRKTPLIPYEAERLPAGETVGGPRYADGDGGDDPAAVELPVLSLLMQAIRTSVPIPFWIGELHLAATLLSIGLLGAGGVARLREAGPRE